MSVITNLLGGSKAGRPAQLNSIVVQQSSYGVPLAIGWGTNRVGANLIWYNNFQSHAQKQSSGKGGGSVTTGYTYTASVMMAIGEGTISGINTVYKDQSVLTPGSTSGLQQAGLSLMTGAASQSVWGYLTTNYPSQAIGYSRTAYVYASNYGLSTSATLQNHSFEVQWATRYGASAQSDALGSDVITDFLTNAVYGVPLWGSGLIASMTTYQTYCVATGLWLSPLLSSTRTAADFLTEILDATNSDAVWSGGQLKIVPYGDTAITANGSTYTPNLTPVYAFTEDDFIPSAEGDDPVKVSLGKTADAYNSVQIEFIDRTMNYNSNTSIASDQASIANYGPRREDVHSLHCICDPGVAAAAAQLRVQRLCNLRRTFNFDLDWRYCLLEPMDLVTLTSGDLSAVLVRITEVDEAADGGLKITAEEMLVGSSHAPIYARQANAGTIINTAIAPGSVNTPILINPPRTLTNGDTQAWIAVSGGSNWGGCQVYTSVDGTNYQLQGTINAPARYGVTTGALGAVADPDTTSSFGVNLSASLGTLNTATAADANAASTLCLVDGELISYQSATLTSAYNYTLGTLLRRGLMGTSVAAHSSSAPFIRLDGGIFKYSYTSQQSGKTIHVKFCSFNVYGQALQDISTVTDYTVTLTPSSSSVAVSWSALTSSGTVPSNVAALTGSEAIQNALLQSALTSGSVTPLVSTGITGQTAWATYGALQPSNVAAPGANLVYDGGLSLKATTWGLGSWYWYVGADIGNYVACNVSGNFANSSRFPVTASLVYTIQTYAATNSSATGSPPQFYIAWYNSSDVYISETSHANIGTSYALNYVTGTAPSGATYGRAILYSNTLSSGAYVWVSKVKVEWGSTATPFNDTATSGALYATGVTIDSLKPAQVSADQTSINTAAGFAGQTSWATYSTLTPAQLAYPGANIIYDGGLTLKGQNWYFGSGWGISFGSDIGYYAVISGPVSSYSYSISPQASVYAGATYTASVNIEGGNPGGTFSAILYVDWHNAGGSVIGSMSPVAVTANVGYQRLSTSGAAPTGAVYGVVVVGVSSLVSGAYVVWYKAKLELGSTATPFSNEATNSALYLSGQSVDSLKPAQANADVTGSNTAAYLAGSGLLAYQNSIAYGSSYATGFGGLAGSNTYYQSSTPTGTISAGSLWTDTTLSPNNVIKQYVSGAWVVIGNYSTSMTPKVATATGTGNVTYASPNTSCHAAFTSLTANGIWSFNAVWNAQSSSTPYSGISTASGTWILVESPTSGGAGHTLFSGTWSSGAYNSGAPGINFAPDTTYGSILQMSGVTAASTMSGSVTVTLYLQITSASGSMTSVTNGITMTVQWTPTQ